MSVNGKNVQSPNETQILKSDLLSHGVGNAEAHDSHQEPT